jgi:hypothetical protein
MGHIIHRIRRLSDGKIGGWIESEENLSQEGNCWVDDEAKVYWGAKVLGNAQVYGNAQMEAGTIKDNARLYDNAWMGLWSSCIKDNAQVYGNASNMGEICDNAQVYDKAVVYGDNVVGMPKVFGDAKIYGNARLDGKMEVNYDVKDKTINLREKKKNIAIIKDFIYKIDDSNKFIIQLNGDDSVDDYFDEPVSTNTKHNTLVICAIDTKVPLFKLEKVSVENEVNYKFIVDITNDDGDTFMIKSIIKDKDQLNTLITQTVEALTAYPQFAKYADDLESCIE